MSQKDSTKQVAYAFFDVDDTLVSVKTMFSFQDYWYCQFDNRDEQVRFEKDMQKRHGKRASWQQLNRLYYQYFAGRNVGVVEQCANEWFNQLEVNTNNLFHQPVVSKLQQHQSAGIEVVFVSGSFPALLMPIAKRFDVKNILATNMEVHNGHYTGTILPPQIIGKGKAQAIKMFLEQKKVNTENCYAYGDDISDAPMLETVGFPYAVTGGRGLVEYAKQKGWPILAVN